MQFPPRLRQGVWQSNTTDLVAPRASPEPASPYLCIYIILYLYLPVPSPELPEATPRSTLALRRCVFQDQKSPEATARTTLVLQSSESSAPQKSNSCTTLVLQSCHFRAGSSQKPHYKVARPFYNCGSKPATLGFKPALYNQASGLPGICHKNEY